MIYFQSLYDSESIQKHSVALTADVEKMYRKVWIHESERHLQQIIWRENQESPISSEDRNPVACDVIKNDFYVDDLLSGSENENLAYDLFNGVSNILASANFTLRKWNSNDLNVLKKISETRKEQEDKVYVCGDLQAKTLDAKHTLTKLIFDDSHLKLMHAGPQLLLSHIRENYWPIGGRNLAKQVVRNCVTRFKVNPKPLEALMGNLPNNRLEAKYPFYATGILLAQITDYVN
ncbi:Integrase zinc binding domain [Popillia japonica]|uniref:Integrase zinc binding domain n=1 Tax=Popillia japonica TaxID=7064 RepID=A0AAW1I6W4_POPJA